MNRLDCRHWATRIVLLAALLAHAAFADANRVAQIRIDFFQPNGDVAYTETDTFVYDQSGRLTEVRFGTILADSREPSETSYTYDYDASGRIVRFHSTSAAGEPIFVTWDYSDPTGRVQVRRAGDTSARSVQLPAGFRQTASLGPRAIEGVEQIDGRAILQTFSQANLDGYRLQILARHFSAHYDPKPAVLGTPTHYTARFVDVQADVTQQPGGSSLQVDYRAASGDRHLGSARVELAAGSFRVRQMQLYDSSGGVLYKATYNWEPQESNLLIEWFLAPPNWSPTTTATPNKSLE